MVVSNWSDISRTFDIDSQGLLNVKNNEDAVVDSILNVLETQQGERFNNILFGSNLRSFIGEPLDEELQRDINDEITHIFETQISYALPVEITYEVNDSEETVSIIIQTYIPELDQIVSVRLV